MSTKNLDKFGAETVVVGDQRVELVQKFHPAEAVKDPDTGKYVHVRQHWTYGYKFNFNGGKQYGNYVRMKDEPDDEAKKLLLESAGQVIESLKKGLPV